MCFSPEASFIASAFLSIMTVASYHQVIRKNIEVSARLGLVLVCASFALQQFCEGLVWLGLLRNFNNLFTKAAIYSFIFFAFIFWPAYIPLCMYRLERDVKLKKILKVFIAIGLTTAILLLVRVIYFGVTAQVASCHIMYNSNISQFNFVATVNIMLAYLIATVGSLLVSSFPKMRLMGSLIGIAYVAAYLFYLNFLISVWCFFAAIISLMIYYLVSQQD